MLRIRILSYNSDMKKRLFLFVLCILLFGCGIAPKTGAMRGSETTEIIFADVTVAPTPVSTQHRRHPQRRP